MTPLPIDPDREATIAARQAEAVAQGEAVAEIVRRQRPASVVGDTDEPDRS